MRYWLGLAFILLGVLIGLQNPGLITIHWFAWSAELPLGMLSLVIFVLGIMLGWLIYPLQRFFRKKS